MKVTAVATLLFATLSLASPAPVAQPEPADLAQLKDAIAARAAEPVPEIDARTAGVQLDEPEAEILVSRKSTTSSSGGGKSSSGKSSSKKSSSKKPKTPKGGNKNNTEGAADTISPSRVLQVGALGLGVMEVVRLWG